MFDYEYWGSGTFSINDNMALEEYMLERSLSSKVATIRFWNVEKDSVVIGYAEDKSNVKRIDSTFDLARRITGGSHVQFDRNCLAYTFTVPRDGSFSHFNDMRKYFAEKVQDALLNLGIDDVEADNRASTINVGGKVIASHAIFWGVESALMHGLMLIDHYDVDKIYERMILADRRIGKRIYREYDALKNAPVATDLLASLLRPIDNVPREKKVAYIKGKIEEAILKEVAGSAYSKKAIDADVLARARSIVAGAHTGTPWLNDRVPPHTEEQVEAIPGEELAGKLRKNLGYCMYIEVPNSKFSKMAEPADDAQR